jgi:hypothetical protein
VEAAFDVNVKMVGLFAGAVDVKTIHTLFLSQLMGGQ